MTISRFILAAGVAVALAAGPAAFAASNHHDTAKGAAGGAAVGHEMGHGHALAGAGAGAAIGHHEGKKAEHSKG